MMDVILGFDTSCYTTSVAAVSTDGRVICNARKLLPVKIGERGLRQSDALFHHVSQLPEMVDYVINGLQEYRIVATCASVKPRNDENSYMPVFRAGMSMAESIASVLRVPFFSTDHQRGHIEAATYGTELNTNSPFLAVHISGGTSQMLYVTATQIRKIGECLDLHAGQFIDRVGVSMGLPFPAGPYLEKLAIRGNAKSLLPASMEKENLCFHLSGAETQCQRWLDNQVLSNEDIASEVFDLLSRCISKMITSGEKFTDLHQVLIAGGVSSSDHLRKLIVKRTRKNSQTLKILFGKNEYSGDNAVGVALQGLKKWKEKIK